MRCCCVPFCLNNGIKYVFVVLWLGVNATLMWYTYKIYRDSPRYFYLHQMLGSGLCWSRGTAAVINLNLGVLLLPMCRSLVAAIRGLSYKIPMHTVRSLIDHCKGFHVLCVYILVFASVVHFLGHSFNAVNFSEHYDTRFVDLNAASYPTQNPIIMVLNSVPGVTGVLLLVILSMIVSSATYAIRTCCYDVFWYVHRLYGVFYLLVLTHGIRGILKQQYNLSEHTPGCMYVNSTEPWPEHEPLPEISDSQWQCSEGPQFQTIGASTWIWVLGPLTIYLVDLCYRIWNVNKHCAFVLNVIQHPSDILQIDLQKTGFTCRPGQYILLQCSSVSSFEWHPFTVTKFTDKVQPHFSIHIKTSGDWAVRLKNALNEIGTPVETGFLLSHQNTNRVYVDGPFGSPMEDISKYNVCLCIAGGIGITPFVAHLQDLSCCDKTQIKRLYLIWLCKERDSFYCFSDTLYHVHRHLWEMNRPDIFDVQLYITGNDDSQAKLPDPDAGIMEFFSKRMYSGRPIWRNVFNRICQAHRRKTIGVFCCGPKSLTESVGEMCNNFQQNKTTFQFYHESF